MGCFLLRTLHLCGCLRSQIPRTSFFPLGFLLFSWCHAQARRAVVGLLRVSFSHTIVGVQYLFGRICLAVCGKVRLVGRVRSGHRWHRYSFIFVDHFRQSWFRSLLAAGVGCAAGTPWWTSTPPPSFENVLPAPGGGTAARRWLFFKECSGIRREAG